MRLIFKLLILIFVISSAHAKSDGIQVEGKKLGKFPFRVLGSGKYQNLNFGS
ncbi:MAG: hypothetical protein K2P81_01020 [Bacteriovoracaceae bacterium]|nr:hypothetical protein [Bacteriovoracaceae bacterium]